MRRTAGKFVSGIDMDSADLHMTLVSTRQDRLVVRWADVRNRAAGVDWVI